MAFKAIYLDHNATTPMRPEVREIMLEMLGFPGNASAVHKAGRLARQRIEEARSRILRFVNADDKAVLAFTSGATEANNLVLRGSGCARVIVSAIEHPSVLWAGSEGNVIPVLPTGVIDMDALEEKLQGLDNQTLISVMYINNETGVIQPINQVMTLAKKYGALVHVDAVQAAGKVDIDLQALGVDYMTLSAHKMGGPQGVGCVIASNCVSVAPQIFGGNQEKNLRAGTENLAAIAGFGLAAELCAQDNLAKTNEIRGYLEGKLQDIAPDIVFFGRDVVRAPNTSFFAVPNLSSETQLIALDLAGICVSNGSACSSGTVKPSHVLKAMGVPDVLSQCALRVSLGVTTEKTEVDAFLAEWSKVYARRS
ncbi:MAG: cysteine desulfurase family protein [Alphaproteobacteria bacterium]|nr:cysteine desulfurase family protein [Alphaproteobacteria bacterium]